MANRLTLVLPSIISNTQSAYIKGRQITDGPLVVSELISWSKKHKSKLMNFKVDFEKAFDSIHWSFLDNVMIQMSFGFIWCNWIKGCFNSATSSVLINGSPSKEFSLERGLRQGDPLSPFMFLVDAEALHVVKEEAIEKKEFRGIRVTQNCNTISHLEFANDVLFVGEWSECNVK
ncbi:RNA-directed DNA polymerase, eukaryota, reverse transcriptase zinc-binding domain protein [Tanacetum coccineum]